MDPENFDLFDLTFMHTTDPIVGAQLGERVILVHPRSKCIGEYCCIHNPSEHHMRSWSMNWRADRRIMERICPHGIGHPDPDDQAYLRLIGRFSEGIHSCDGCCAEPSGVLLEARR